MIHWPHIPKVLFKNIIPELPGVIPEFIAEQEF
jgi:hypothetical protein